MSARLIPKLCILRKEADIAIHECFAPAEVLIQKQNYEPTFALCLSTMGHTSPAQFGKVMADAKPRMAVGYHFYKVERTAIELMRSNASRVQLERVSFPRARRRVSESRRSLERGSKKEIEMPREVGDRYVCEECGAQLVYEKACPCPERMPHSEICCGKQMKRLDEKASA